jgi:signal transduction histidine kinase
MGRQSTDQKQIALRNRLSFRHSILTVFVALGVGLGFSVVEFFLSLHEERGRVAETVDLVLDMVTDPAASAAYAIDSALAQRIADRLISSPDILLAEIKDNFGHSLGRAERPPADPRLTRIAAYALAPMASSQRALFDNTAIGKKIHVGDLTVAVDNGVIIENLRNDISRMVLSSMIRAIVIAAIVAVLFHVLTTGPLLRLAGAVAALEPSQPIRQLVAEPPGHARDELGVMTLAINRLIMAFQNSLEDRDRIGEDLRQLAESLERRVEERTVELARTNENLRLAMDHLVATEKLASLGQLVAGVAHELNTPIGNILTVASTLQTRVDAFSARIRAGSIQRSVLDTFVTESLTATGMLVRAAETAAEMIRTFKQVAVDQGSFGRRRFDLAVTVRELLSSMRNKLKKSLISIDLDIPDGLILDNHPGPIEQILTNFIMNSLLHAFDEGQSGTIQVTARRQGDDLALTYRDNGRGMPEETARHAFDPFFTTKFGQGGSGLGLYIVHNLVTGVLSGTVRMTTAPGAGTRFDLLFPLDAASARESRIPDKDG